MVMRQLHAQSGGVTVVGSTRTRNIRETQEAMDKCARIVEAVHDAGIMKAGAVKEGGKFPGDRRYFQLGLRGLKMHMAGSHGHNYYDLFMSDFPPALYLFEKFDGRVAASVAEGIRQPVDGQRLRQLRPRLREAGLVDEEVDAVFGLLRKADDKSVSGGP